ncbi:MAG: NADPH-dependent FMN reductase [Acidimicrobiia bacterium]
MQLLTVCGSLQARSANRAALDVVHAHARAAGADIDEFDALAAIPPLDPDAGDDPGVVVDDWRARIARADAVVIASPEYAGAVAGVVKNALDWIVGSGELYTKPVGLITAGTSGGYHARAALVQTLTWQGAHVVASLGIDAPRTKIAADGRFADVATLAVLREFADRMVGASALTPDDRLGLVYGIVEAASVEPGHVAPLT